MPNDRNLDIVTRAEVRRARSLMLGILPKLDQVSTTLKRAGLAEAQDQVVKMEATVRDMLARLSVVT